MKTPDADKDRLVDDILLNESYASFRASLYESTLAELRATRRSKRRTQFLALAACVPFALILFSVLSPNRFTKTEPQPFDVIVRSVPLSADQIVSTRDKAVARVLTKPMKVNPVTGLGSVDVVRTDYQAAAAESISDEQLLSLFKDHPVALVSAIGGARRFIFLDPADQTRFVEDLNLQ
jgi:hypothetical protein